MPKILVTRNLGPAAMQLLTSSPFEIILNPEDAAPTREWTLTHIADPEVVAVCLMHPQPSDKVDQEFLDKCNPNMKCLSTMSVGYDHIDVKAANAKGIKIGHTPGVLDNAVADITVMLVLMTMRRVGEGIDLIYNGGWPNLPWAPFAMCGPSIGHPSLTIGFLGFGRISQSTVDRLLAFTSKTHPPTIIYHSSRARPNQLEIDKGFSAKWGGIKVERVEKDELARKSDVVIVLCSLNEQTKGLVNKEFLKIMKKSAVLVNTARGPVVETQDLSDALDAGEIFGAGVDVITGEPNVGPENPLVKNTRCVVLPHMGSADIDTRNAMADLCARNALSAAMDQPLPAEVRL